MRTILILALLPLLVIAILAGALLFNPDAQFQIGEAFMNGSVVPKDYNTAIFWLRQAANKGHTQAQSSLGRCFLFGIPNQNLPEAIKYLELGAKKEDFESMKLLSYAYAYGQGVPQNYKESLSLSRRILKKERDTREIMGLSFLDLILPAPYRNYQEAHDLAVELAMKGYPSPWAYWCLGVNSEFGTGTSRDYNEAAKWYKRGAELGDEDSQYGLVRLRLQGKVAADMAEVLHYLNSSSDEQFLDSQILLALLDVLNPEMKRENASFNKLLDRLKERGFAEYSDRLKYLKSIASRSTLHDNAATIFQEERKRNDGIAHFTNSILLANGFCGKPDSQAFLSELDRAIKSGSGDAMVYKANLLSGFELGDPDYPEAIRLYKAGSKNGNAYADAQLGMLYALGLGVKQNWPLAIQYLNKASDKGDPTALYCLGGFYSDGRGVLPDRKKAIDLYERAGKAGNHEAYMEVGILYGMGQFPDIDQDQEKATVWLKRAAGAGLQEANYHLGRITAEDEPEQSINAYEKAAGKGHLLSMIEAGKYHLEMEELSKAQPYLDRAANEGSTQAKALQKRMAITRATLRFCPEARQHVVAAQEIPEGTLITKEMVRLETLVKSDRRKEGEDGSDRNTDNSRRSQSPKENASEGDDGNKQACASSISNDDAIETEVAPLIGTEAKETINAGSDIRSYQLAVPGEGG